MIIKEITNPRPKRNNDKQCIDCGKEPVVERKRCKECALIFNRERVKQYHKKDKPRYGIIKCTVCGEDMIKNRPDQLYHGKCRFEGKPKTGKYNEIKRSKEANMIARQIILDLGFNLNSNIIVHHIDENPNNNILSNFMILSRSNHGKIHQFLNKQWLTLRKINTENLDEKWYDIRNQLTNTWLELIKLPVIQLNKEIVEIDENKIYIFKE